MYTNRLQVKQKAKIVNYRWAVFFGELLVCFAAKPYASVMVKQPLLKIFWLEQHWMT